jgi:hypothetical protein
MGISITDGPLLSGSFLWALPSGFDSFASMQYNFHKKISVISQVQLNFV